MEQKQYQQYMSILKAYQYQILKCEMHKETKKKKKENFNQSNNKCPLTVFTDTQKSSCIILFANMFVVCHSGQPYQEVKVRQLIIACCKLQLIASKHQYQCNTCILMHMCAFWMALQRLVTKCCYIISVSNLVNTHTEYI